MTKLKHWFTNYFSSSVRISPGRRAGTIVLGVLLFIALIVFGVVMDAQLTVYNPNYVASYVNQIDVSTSVTNWLNEKVAPQKPTIAKAAEAAVNYYEPQIKDALESLVRTVYSFFLTKMEQGKLIEAVTEQQARVDDIANNIQEVLNIPALKSIFSNLGIDPGVIGDKLNVDQINSYFDLINRAAKYQSLAVFVEHFYVPLIIILIALIIAIIFLGRRFRFVFAILGIVFVTYGITQLSSILPLGNYARTVITNLSLQSLAQGSAMQFISDSIRILNIFAGVILFVGLLFILAYFLIRPRIKTN